MDEKKYILASRKLRMCLVALGIKHEVNVKLIEAEKVADLRIGNLLVFIETRFPYNVENIPWHLAQEWHEKNQQQALKDEEVLKTCKRLGYRVLKLWDSDPLLLNKLREKIKPS